MQGDLLSATPGLNSCRIHHGIRLKRGICAVAPAYLQQSMTILLPMRRVAALHGRIDALYLNAGRQFFGECAVHHGRTAQAAIMTCLPRDLSLAVRALLSQNRCSITPSHSCGDCAGDTPNSDMRQMQLVFETNFWGPVRVFQSALPLFPKTGDLACIVCAGGLLRVFHSCVSPRPLWEI